MFASWGIVVTQIFLGRALGEESRWLTCNTRLSDLALGTVSDLPVVRTATSPGLVIILTDWLTSVIPPGSGFNLQSG